MKIIYRDKTIVSNVVVADSFLSRLSGYMFRTSPHKAAILFRPGIAIHTFFMKFPLDVIFMDQEYRILKIYRNLQPWRHTCFFFKASNTLEMPVGLLPLDLKEGDFLEVKFV